MCKIPGVSQSSTTRDAGVSRRTVQNILNRKIKLEIRVNEKGSCNHCHVNIQKSNDDVNFATFERFTRMREEHDYIHLLEKVIYDRDHKIAERLEINNLKVSKGWFRR